jgi:curved DNA-binding protein
MDYYSVLGLKQGASADEIKKAYRSLAMKFHPDRGGDEKRFKEIEEAYRFLSDPEKKQMVDMGVDPNNQQGFQDSGFHFHSNNFDDIFRQFGFGFNRQRPQRRNSGISINVALTLNEVLSGKELNAELTMPNGGKKLINITIPPGVEHGQQIKYNGMGDRSIPNIPPGDLIVNIQLMPHPVFRREHNNLVIDKKIPVWDAILGSKFEINTLDGKNLNITVPAGTQPDTVLSCSGEGLPSTRSKARGNLLIRIKVEIPRSLTPEQKQAMEKIKNGV